MSPPSSIFAGMATVYRSWHQTRLVPSRTSRGSLAVNYDEELVQTHAVAEEDGVLSDHAVCGLRVSGEVEGAFGPGLVLNGCGRCADRLGIGHVDS